MNDTPESPRQSLGAATIATLLGPKVILETQRDGWRAAVAGEHVRTCPYRERDPRTDALRQMWTRGYAAGLTDLRAARATAPTDEDPRQSPKDAGPPESI